MRRLVIVTAIPILGVIAGIIFNAFIPQPYQSVTVVHLGPGGIGPRAQARAADSDPSFLYADRILGQHDLLALRRIVVARLMAGRVVITADVMGSPVAAEQDAAADALRYARALLPRVRPPVDPPGAAPVGPVRVVRPGCRSPGRVPRAARVPSARPRAPDIGSDQRARTPATLDMAAFVPAGRGRQDERGNPARHIAGGPGPGRPGHHGRCPAYPARDRRAHRHRQERALHPGREEEPARPARIRNLPWKDVPPGHSERSRGHGRQERRDLKVTAAAAGLGFPHAARAIRISRRVRPVSGAGRWKTRTVYAITSLNAAQATPAELAGWIRGHWRIEAVHHIRDATTARTHPRPAPPAAPAPWPPCATSPSAP